MRSSGGGGGRNRRKQQQPTSMGRALLLLSIATTSNAFTSCSPSTITQLRCNSALQYRYGNDDNQPSIDMKQFNINSAAMHRRRRSHHMSSRPLSKPTTKTPLPSPPTQRPTIELEQEMDEYIEYLDRRYTRMHDPKRSPSKIVYKYFNLQGKIISSLLPSPTTSSGSSNNKDHTIKILGLSGLASKQLRQRLHVVSTTTTTSSRRRTSKKMAVSTRSSSSSSSSAIVMRSQAIPDKVISSIRSICNFFSLNIIPELLATTAGVTSLAMLLLIRPLLNTIYLPLLFT